MIINSSNLLLRAGVVGNTLTATPFAVTGMTIDGVAVTGFAGSGNNYTFNTPALATGTILPRFCDGIGLDHVDARITDGVSEEIEYVGFFPAESQDFVTLESITLGIGSVCNYITCAIGDQIVFDRPVTLGVSTNRIDVDGTLVSDFGGTQDMWHRRATDGLITKLVAITNPLADTTPEPFSFTSVTNAELNTTYTSNAITVSGIDALVPVAISVTDGSYSVNGGAFTTAPGTVMLGDTVMARTVSSSTYATAQIPVLVTIGSTSGQFHVGTRLNNLLPDQFTFIDVTEAELAGVYESNVITVSGVTAGVNISIIIHGSADSNAAYSVNTGAGFGPYTADAGVVQLGHQIKVRVTAKNQFNSSSWVGMNINGVVGTFSITTKSAPSILSINDGAGVRIGSTGNAIITARIPNASYFHINSIVMSSFSGSDNSYTFTAPALVNGSTCPRFGNVVSAIGNDGADIVSLGTNFYPKVTQDFVTITSTNMGVGQSGWIGLLVTLHAGDQILFDRPVAYSETNYVDENGLFISNRTGVQTIWHRNVFTEILTELLVDPATLVVDSRPNQFTFTDIYNANLNTDYTSNAITVSDIDSGVSVAISVSNGSYSLNGGDFTTAPGTVILGDIVMVKTTTGSDYFSATTCTLFIGDKFDKYSVTTIAADLEPTSFSFTNVANAALSTQFVSNICTMRPIHQTDAAMPISITDGEYSIESAPGVWSAYTASSDGINVYNKRFRVRGTSSASPSTTTNVALNIGGIVATFSIATRVADNTPEPFSFTSVTNANLNTDYTSNAITVSGIDSGVSVAISVSNGSYSLNGGAFTSVNGVVGLNDQVRLRVISSATNNATVTATLTIGGISDAFSVTTAPITDDQPNAPVLVLAKTHYESAEFTIADITPGATVFIGVSNAEYAVNSGAGFGTFTAVNGTVRLNDVVKLRMSVTGTTVPDSSCTLTLGGNTYLWEVACDCASVSDLTPDTFSIQPVVNAPISTLMESQSFAVAGVDSGADIAVVPSGLEWSFSRNGVWSAYRADTANVRLGDLVRVRKTSSAINSGVVNGTISIGDINGTYTVTTIASTGVTPGGFSFANAIELEPNEEVSSTVVTVAGVPYTTPLNCSVTNGSYSVNAGSGWGPWLASPSVVRLGYRVRLKRRANRLFGGTSIVGLTIGTESANWTLHTTSKTVSSSTQTTKYHNFTYPLQPASKVVRERILLLMETLVPNIPTPTLRKAIWNDVLDLVRYTDFTLSSMPSIDFTGFAYRNLPSLAAAVNGSGSAQANFRADYYNAMEYIVRECWQELALLMITQADCTVSKVVVRKDLITLQCTTKS